MVATPARCQKVATIPGSHCRPAVGVKGCCSDEFIYQRIRGAIEIETLKATRHPTSVDQGRDSVESGCSCGRFMVAGLAQGCVYLY
jgi:hypothetical protein